MTYRQARSSLQLMAEERIGAYLRAQRAEAEAGQDQASKDLEKAFGLK
jgi:hypothetical protein